MDFTSGPGKHFRSFDHNQPALAALLMRIRSILVYTLGLPTQAKAVAKRIFPDPDQEIFRQGLIEQVTQADPRAYRAAMRALARFDVRKRLNEYPMSNPGDNW